MTDPSVKFNRRYKLLIELNSRSPGAPKPSADGFAVIEPPYTLEFSVVRNYLASANTATFKVYNLNARSRDRIYKDRYSFKDLRAVQLWAGYGSNLSLIFNGQVQQAWSYRESGSTNVITEIEAHEAYAMVNGRTSVTLGAGQTLAQVIQRVARDLPDTDAPKLGNLPGTLPRGTVLFGNTWEIIKQYTGGNATIDNNRLLVLQPNEAISGGVGVINAETGLLGSPYRSNAIVEFDMLFTPQFEVGQLVRLDSKVNKIFNKYYRVAGFTHTGTVSEASCGDARTLVQLWSGTSAFTTI